MIHVSAEKTRSNTRERGDGTLVQFALKGGMAKPALERPGTRMAIRTGLRVRMGRYPAEIARKVQWRSKIGVGIGIGIEGPGAIQHRNRSRFRFRSDGSGAIAWRLRQRDCALGEDLLPQRAQSSQRDSSFCHRRDGPQFTRWKMACASVFSVTSVAGIF